MKKWDFFVESHQNGTSFQMSGWLRTILDTYDFITKLLCVKNTYSEITAILPLFRITSIFKDSRIVSLPFSDYGGQLIGWDDKEADIVRTALTRITAKAKSTEIRGPISESNSFSCQNYYKQHLLDLGKDPAELIKSINKRAIQYSIRRAEKTNIVIRETNSEAGILEFVRLNSLTRKKHGIPSLPNKWFKALYRNVISARKGFFLLVERNTKVIGASILLTCNRSLHYKYNVSDPKFLRPISPNHLLTWTTIKLGAENNFSFLDFGRSSPDNKGLMRYKALWGVKVIDLTYYYYPKIKCATSMKETSIAYSLAINILKHTPDKITDKFSSLFFKHLA